MIYVIYIFLIYQLQIIFRSIDILSTTRNTYVFICNLPGSPAKPAFPFGPVRPRSPLGPGSPIHKSDDPGTPCKPEDKIVFVPIK